MDTLELLGVALGLATLAGINLYLTVFLTGITVHFGWLTLPNHLDTLNVLGNPWIWGIALVLYVLEFFADKVPWVDSLNDAVHTAIRPVGGALLGVLALGQSDPVIQVVAALLAGGAALTAHLSKAGVRLVANASPEPVSNVALSLGEDVIVFGSIALLFTHPLVMGILAIIFLGVVITLLPNLWRSTASTAWLAWKKLKAPAQEAAKLPGTLPDDVEFALRRAKASSASLRAVFYCLAQGGKLLPKNIPGWLVLLEGEREHAYFVAKRLFRGVVVIDLPLTGQDFERKTRFLSESLSFVNDKVTEAQFAFDRGHPTLANRAAEELHDLVTFTEVVIEPPTSELAGKSQAPSPLLTP